MNKLNNTIASGLVSSAVLASLVGTLAGKGVLADEDVRELYEHALLMLEDNQGGSGSPEFASILEDARSIIAEQLKP